MKKSITIVGLTIFYSSILVPRAYGQAGEFALPRDWYILPEQLRHDPSFAGPAGSSEAELVSSEEQLRGLFFATQQGLDTMAQRSWAPSSMAGSDWEASALQLYLAITATGTIGALVGEGTSSTTVQWVPTESGHRGHTGATRFVGGKKPLAFHISTSASLASVEQTIDAISASILATGRVQYRATLRHYLKKFIVQAYRLTSALTPARIGGWEPTQFTMYLGVEGSGMVQPSIIAGGALQVQLVFDIVHDEGSAIEPDDLTEQEKTQRSQLIRLAESLKIEMDATPDLRIANHGFKADQVSVYVGMTGEGDIGAASVEGQFYGALTYEPQGTLPVVLSPEATEPSRQEPILLISRSSPKLRQEPGSRGVLARDEPSFPENTRSMIPPGTLRRGLKRAYGMSGFLTKVGSAVMSRRWTLDSIQPSFTLGIGGDLVFATITADVGVTINMTRI